MSPGTGRPRTCYVWGPLMGPLRSGGFAVSHMRGAATPRAGWKHTPPSRVGGALTSDIIASHDAVGPDTPVPGEQHSAAWLPPCWHLSACGGMPPNLVCRCPSLLPFYSYPYHHHQWDSPPLLGGVSPNQQLFKSGAVSNLLLHTQTPYLKMRISQCWFKHKWVLNLWSIFCHYSFPTNT